MEECYTMLAGQEGSTCLGSFYRQAKGMYFEVSPSLQTPVTVWPGLIRS